MFWKEDKGYRRVKMYEMWNEIRCCRGWEWCFLKIWSDLSEFVPLKIVVLWYWLVRKSIERWIFHMK